MRAVIIDDEIPSLDEIRYFLLKSNVDVVGAFTEPYEGYDSIVRELPDAVFLDIEMPGINGVELGIRIQEAHPGVTIIFITAHSQYSLEAYRAHPVDFIVKPIDEDRLLETLSFINSNIFLSKRKKETPAQISCFGKFYVMSVEPVKFATQKSRDLLIYLLCSADKKVYRDELIDLFFGTKNIKRGLNHLRVTLYRLRNTLSTCNISKEELNINEDYSVQIKDGICDYIDFCRFIEKNPVIGPENAQEAKRIIDLYKGELLNDIEEIWVEEKRQWAAVAVEELIIKTAACFRYSCKDEAETERLLLRLTEIDPYSEQGYVLLLDFYNHSRDDIRFKLVYKRYQKAMEELGVPLERKYTAYFEKI